jgi:hypothetical protein
MALIESRNCAEQIANPRGLTLQCAAGVVQRFKGSKVQRFRVQRFTRFTFVEHGNREPVNL